MKSVLKSIAANILIYAALCVVTFLMLRTIIGYGSFNTKYAFLSQKQEYLQNKFWLFCFYTHVFTSIFAFIAGYTQFSKYILKYHKKIHRNIGKLYVIAVLFVNVPTAFVMAIYANGLWNSKLAFLVLDILWFYFTYKGWTTALSKNFKSHKEWMMRSYALTFSAITLRTWKLILAPFVHDTLTLYMIDAWMGFVPNLLFIEMLIRFRKMKLFYLPKFRDTKKNKRYPRIVKIDVNNKLLQK